MGLSPAEFWDRWAANQARFEAVIQRILSEFEADTIRAHALGVLLQYEQEEDADSSRDSNTQSLDGPIRNKR
jgi:hypothetical protein